MIENGQKWSKMVKMVKNGQKWSKMVKNGQNGQKWSKMVKNGQNGRCGKIKNGRNHDPTITVATNR